MQRKIIPAEIKAEVLAKAKSGEKVLVLAAQSRTRFCGFSDAI